MKHKLVRFAIGVLAAFIALSAIGGGIVLLAGTYKDGVLIEAGGRGQFPLEWLHNTPFSGEERKSCIIPEWRMWLAPQIMSRFSYVPSSPRRLSV